MSIPSISALPTAPSTSDLSTLSSRHNAWVAAFTNTTVAEFNAAISAMNALALADEVQSSAYATTAGALLTVGSFGLGADSGQSFADMNSAASQALRNGWYRIDGGTSNGPPGVSFGTCLRVRYNSGAYHDLVFDAGNGTIWLRYFSTSFQAWRRIYNSATVLGTVSETSGTPTGALIERGSGANGQYVRFADGTQICTHSLTSSTSSTVTWTYQAAFADLDGVLITPNSTTAATPTTAGPGNTSSVSFNCWNTSGTRVAETCWLQATGRWFT